MLLSRFRADSELSALNRSGRRRASPDLVRVTELALAARQRTGGRFDPTVHDALVAAGYDRSFEEVRAGSSIVATRPPARCRGAVAVSAQTREIVLGPGVRLDFGGIGKGYAVDRACDLLAPSGPCLVSAGGDLAVRGGSWPVGVETLGDGSSRSSFRRRGRDDGRLDRRRWADDRGPRRTTSSTRRQGDPQKEISCGSRPSAATAADAEVLAKTLYLAGAGSGEVGGERVAGPRPSSPRADGRDVLRGRPARRADPTFWHARPRQRAHGLRPAHDSSWRGSCSSHGRSGRSGRRQSPTRIASWHCSASPR